MKKKKHRKQWRINAHQYPVKCPECKSEVFIKPTSEFAKCMNCKKRFTFSLVD